MSIIARTPVWIQLDAWSQASVADIESDVMTKWNMTTNAIFIELWKVASIPKIVISCRVTMENNLLRIIHCVSVLFVRLKNRKYWCQKLTMV